ncbi:MAG: hypothetical protein GF320_11365 [Armatimonadia bacterium]|nr:hypothetical protein [Armatimonadia bacterium]
MTPENGTSHETKRKRTTPQERNRALQMIQMGVEHDVIAAQMGVSVSSVHRWRRDAEQANEVEALRAEISRLEAITQDRRRFDLQEAVDAYIASELREREPRPLDELTVWVTTLSSSWPTCKRKAVLETTHRHHRKPRTVDSSRSLVKGNLEELVLKRVLAQRAIFLPEDQSQAYLRDDAERWKLSGRIDARMPEPDNRILEVKSASTFVFDDIQRLRDKGGHGLTDSRFPWVRGYYRQVQSYLMLSGEPEAVLVLAPREFLKAIQWDMPRDEECIAQLRADLKELRGYCERIREAILATGTDDAPEVLNELPEYPPLEEDPDCEKYCDFPELCNCSMRFAPTTTGMCRDLPLLEDVIERDQLEESGKRYKALSTEINARVKQHPTVQEGSDVTALMFENGAAIEVKKDRRGAVRVSLTAPPRCADCQQPKDVKTGACACGQQTSPSPEHQAPPDPEPPPEAPEAVGAAGDAEGEEAAAG